MSGGHFNYQQFRLEDIASEIDELIERQEYGVEIIEKFKLAAKTLRTAQRMAHRIDYLVSGDDGEETFLERWEKEFIQEGKKNAT